MRRILIQPVLHNFSQYNSYALRNGFGLDIADFCAPDVLDARYVSVLRHYRHRLKHLPKPLSEHGPFWDIYIDSQDSKIRKASEQRIKKNLAIAKSLGVRYVIFHTNAQQIPWQPYHEQWVKQHIQFWRRMLRDYAGTILLENMLDETPEWIRQVFRGVGSPRLRFCFDIGHANVFSRVPLAVWFKNLGQYMAYIHLNDNHGDEDSHVVLGTGTVPWTQFNRLVRRYCRNPDVVIEVDSLAAVKRSIVFLKQNGIYPFSKATISCRKNN